MATIKDLDGNLLNLDSNMVIIEKSGGLAVEGSDDNFRFIQDGRSMYFGEKLGEMINKLMRNKEMLEDGKLSEKERVSMVYKIEQMTSAIQTASLTAKKKITGTAFVIKI